MNNILNNNFVIGFVSLFLTLYATLIAPKLPNNVIQFFDTIIGKLFFLFLIAFFSSKNIQISIMIALAYTITLHIANKNNTEEYIDFVKNYNKSKEHFVVNNTDNEEHFEVENFFKKLEKKDIDLVKLATCQWYKSLKDSPIEKFENYHNSEYFSNREFGGDEEFEGNEDFTDVDSTGDEFFDPALEEFTNSENFEVNRQVIKDKSFLHILKNYGSNIYNHKKMVNTDNINDVIKHYESKKIEGEKYIEKMRRKEEAKMKISEICKKKIKPDTDEYFKNLNNKVVPAYNLSGDPKKMYSPV